MYVKGDTSEKNVSEHITKVVSTFYEPPIGVPEVRQDSLKVHRSTHGALKSRTWPFSLPKCMGEYDLKH